MIGSPRSLSLSLMKIRFSSILGWTAVFLVSALTLFSAIMGFMPQTDPVAIEMGTKLGVTGLEMPLGIIKILIVALFVYPRTSTVGFVLMIGYYGGALATNITHGFTPAEYGMLYIVLGLLTLSAYVRNPELLTRIKGKPVIA